MDSDDLLALLRRTADAVIDALAEAPDWGPSGTKTGQYASDLVADSAALEVLAEAGVGVLSEESGRTGDADGTGVVVVVDPLDGSTNASHGVSWWATSLCAVDADGPCAAVVHDLRHGTRYEATRGGGAWRDGGAVTPSGASSLSTSLVGLSGMPPRWLGWKQFRSLGASALDLCAVADGTIDGFMDCSADAHGSWDYLGALLICQEAGAVMVDAFDRDLIALEHADRRTPVAAATPELLDEMVAARQTFGS